MTAPDPWPEALAGPAACARETPASVAAALEAELVSLWSDLAEAHRMAADHVWSVQCEGLVERIVRLTRALGTATPWAAVPTVLSLNGVYQAVHSGAGISVAEPDVAELRDQAELAGCVPCAGCARWGGIHGRDCPEKPRSQYDLDQERLRGRR